MWSVTEDQVERKCVTGDFLFFLLGLLGKPNKYGHITTQH